MGAVTTTHSTDLADILTQYGVEVKSVGQEITGKCPVHFNRTGRHDGHPSWSMNADTGLWICFSCGARGTLSSLLYEIVGEGWGAVHDHVMQIQTTLIKSGLDRLNSDNTSSEELSPAVDVSQFSSFQRVSDTRCHSRSLDPDTTFKYGVRWNPERKAWAIPIMKHTGKLMGWQEKRSSGVLNYPNGVEKSITLFGIERFRGGTSVLVESPLDVVRFASTFEFPCALASFGAFVSAAQVALLLHVSDTVVIAMDNDKAGIESSKRLYKTMPRPRNGLRWWNYKGMDVKDIGDMTDSQIEKGFVSATVVPPWVV
jgi:hypothetical protein